MKTHIEADGSPHSDHRTWSGGGVGHTLTWQETASYTRICLKGTSLVQMCVGECKAGKGIAEGYLGAGTVSGDCKRSLKIHHI